MAQFCSACGAQMADGSSACPSCGKSTSQGVGGGAAAAPAQSGGGLDNNIAGALAYFTFIPAVIFLVMEPYSKNKFIRFHSFQCLFLTAGLFAIHLVLNFIPILGQLASMLVGLASLVVWVILVVKAYGNQMFKLPVIGDMAEKQANAM